MNTVPTRKINILYIIDSLTYGGTEKQLVQLMRSLDPERFRVHLCTLKPSENLYNELDVPKICLDFHSFARFSTLGKIAKLVAYIRRHHIDIVQTFFQDPFLLGALVKPFTRIKLVGSFRDLGFWRTAAESRKMRMASPLYDGFIANSQAVKTHFCAIDNIDPQKIEVIYNGTHIVSNEKCTAQLQGGNGPVVGIVANLNRPVKRVQDFISAAALIHRQLPEAKFLVVGGGHLQSDLERQAAQLGVAAVTTFTGMVSNPLDYIARFSVGVITSETEGFCNALIEYMACGLPVVATRVGGNVEMVRDRENGFLYDVGEIDQLSEKITLLLNDSVARNRIANLNRRMVPERFSMETMVTRTGDYYEKLMSGAAT